MKLLLIYCLFNLRWFVLRSYTIQFTVRLTKYIFCSSTGTGNSNMGIELDYAQNLILSKQWKVNRHCKMIVLRFVAMFIHHYVFFGLLIAQTPRVSLGWTIQKSKGVNHLNIVTGKEKERNDFGSPVFFVNCLLQHKKYTFLKCFCQ